MLVLLNCHDTTVTHVNNVKHGNIHTVKHVMLLNMVIKHGHDKTVTRVNGIPVLIFLMVLQVDRAAFYSVELNAAEKSINLQTGKRLVPERRHATHTAQTQARVALNEVEVLECRGIDRSGLDKRS